MEVNFTDDGRGSPLEGSDENNVVATERPAGIFHEAERVLEVTALLFHLGIEVLLPLFLSCFSILLLLVEPVLEVSHLLLVGGDLLSSHRSADVVVANIVVAVP